MSFNGINTQYRRDEWQRRGKTYRAKSLAALRQLYAAGVHATLEGQPELQQNANLEPKEGQHGISETTADKRPAK